MGTLKCAEPKWIGIAIALLCWAARASPGGEPFNASLSVSDSNHSQSTTQPSQTSERRPVLESTTDLPLSARWKMTYVGGPPAADVLVHFFVVRIDKLGQDPPALDPAIVLVESALLMDFDPNSSSSADLPFRIDNPGKYLVWIEATIGQGNGSKTQHAAVELIVK